MEADNQRITKENYDLRQEIQQQRRDNLEQSITLETTKDLLDTMKTKAANNK